MRDPLEFDSEKIFKLEALLGNCQAIIKDLEQRLAATDLKWQGAEKALQLCEQRLAELELTKEVQGWRQTELMLEDAYARMDIMNEQLKEAEAVIEFYAKQTGCECSPDYVPVMAREYRAKYIKVRTRQARGNNQRLQDTITHHQTGAT